MIVLYILMFKFFDSDHHYTLFLCPAFLLRSFRTTLLSHGCMMKWTTSGDTGYRLQCQTPYVEVLSTVF
jgi:hypothetical protein